MKKNLLSIEVFLGRKLSLLLLSVFMSSGMIFSQKTINVTSDADSGPNTLRQAIADAADGDVINFNGVTTIKVGEPLLLGDKTLTIDGGSTVVLDGALTGTDADTFRIATIIGVVDKTVTLTNLTLQNGYARDTTGSSMYNGGAVGGGALFIYNYDGGQTVLDNCIFQNNKSFARGGAVKVWGGATINNCQFLNNTAEDASEGDGGALYAHAATISGCTFSGNVAADRGGAANVDTLCVLTNSIFTGNSAGDHGGGIYSLDTTVMIAGCIFDGNTSAGRAGGMYLNYGTATNCEIKNNISGDHGGGVWLNTAILTNSLITGKKTDPDEDGGGVGMTYTSILANCTITGNYASDQGGGVFARAGLIQNCIITGNTAKDDGGGLYMDDYELDPARTGGSTYLVGCVVANNEAVEDNSGGIYLEAGAIVNSIITQNHCADDAGGIEGRNGPWIIVNSVVYGNTAADQDANMRFSANNGAPLSAAHSAFDAEGVDDMVSANMFTLNKSPFIGGSGADSLMFPDGSLLIDAGTDQYGIAAVLPTLDLAGNPRLDGPIDIGPYEKVGGFVKVDVTGVTLDQATLTVDQGSTDTLVATVAPANASIDTVNWSSDNEAVATVADGVVTGVAAGTATITATTVDGSFTATCAVTVEATTVAVTGVELDQTTLTLDVDATATLVATVSPAEATDPSVSWASDNEAVATVADGVVTAVAAGTATITVTTTDGGFTATCAVTVNTATVAVTGGTLDQSTLALEPGETATLVATVAPGNATDKSVSWSSDNTAVATVADGVVTAVADGTATITVTTTDGGKTATCAVTVESVGIETHKANGFNLYPNPVSGGMLYIELSDPGIRSFEVYNTLGMMVHSEMVNGRTLIEVDAPAIHESGYYFIKMIKEESSTVERFVVQ